jgi:lipoate-protein ligase A
VSLILAELYDYDVVRSEPDATMYCVRPDHATLVLGSAQTTDLLDANRLGDVALRRRRGGGGLVLLQPDDLWIDWWIPADDDRWRRDVHASSRMAGQWWADVLRPLARGEVTVHDGPLEGDPAYRPVCFAGRGPGEVFVDDKKAVGVTQWRVREGIFLSTVMPAHASHDVLQYLRDVPNGLEDALDHQVLSSITGASPESLLEALRRSSAPWQFRAVPLHA